MPIRIGIKIHPPPEKNVERDGSGRVRVGNPNQKKKPLPFLHFL